MITVKVEVGSSREAEKLVEEDIRKFEEYFVSLGNDPLNKFEFSILKTYLAFKLDVVPKRK